MWHCVPPYTHWRARSSKSTCVAVREQQAKVLHRVSAILSDNLCRSLPRALVTVRVWCDVLSSNSCRLWLIWGLLRAHPCVAQISPQKTGKFFQGAHSILELDVGDVKQQGVPMGQHVQRGTDPREELHNLRPGPWRPQDRRRGRHVEHLLQHDALASHSSVTLQFQSLRTANRGAGQTKAPFSEQGTLVRRASPQMCTIPNEGHVCGLGTRMRVY